jgi:MFS family permease
MTLWIPDRPPTLAESDTSTETGAQRMSGFAKVSTLLILAAVFIYSLAEQALWQFSLELALDRGIGSAEASHVLGATVLMGLIGGAIAATVGLRFGRVFPIVIGTLFSVAGRWIYISAGSVELLWVGGLLWGLGFYFVTPYQFGLAAALDRRGRIVVAAAGLSNLGYGVGPSIAGRIRQYQIDNALDHSMLIWLIAGGTFLSLLLLLPVAIRQEKDARAARAI